MVKWVNLIISACKRKEEQQVNGGPQPAAPKKPRLVFTDIQRRTLQVGQLQVLIAIYNYLRPIYGSLLINHLDDFGKFNDSLLTCT